MFREDMIKTALGRQDAELVIKNARILNVFTGEILPGDIAVTGGMIAGVGDYSNAACVEDAGGQFAVPGLINTHCHVESSMMTPEIYCREELRWGVTTVITDPHEAANVAGVDGIRFMRESAQGAPIDYFIQIPSCVPSTAFEHNGASIDAEDIWGLIGDRAVSGVGEMMNYPGVLDCNKAVLSVLDAAGEKTIDGHAPALSGKELQAYSAAGIRTDHESTTFNEALEKLRAGIAVLVREGSAAKDVQAVISGVVEHGVCTDMMAFCTDDKHIADIRREGTVRHCIRLSIALGLAPIAAYRMATINAARIYGLKNLGAVAPGYQADFILLSDLEDVAVSQVYKRGVRVFPGEYAGRTSANYKMFPNSVNIAPINETSFALPHREDGRQPVINIAKNRIVTEKSFIRSELARDMLASGQLCKVAVVERHRATGNIGVGLLAGYGLKNGAIASTVSHDSHNIIVAGTSDSDMLFAVREIERMRGGYALVRDGVTLGELPLPLFGLMCDRDPDEFIKALDELIKKCHKEGVNSGIDPFIALSFMALPVIPEIRVTDMGVFDAVKFEFI